jgi:GNAT superfamily N-acetyltransferase
MPDPRKTGISSITEKMVVIRHANDTDRVIVGEYLKQNHTDTGLDDADVVIAAEDERIIGFGILKKGDDAGCVSLFEDSRRRGIGSTILSHLMEYSPVKKVYGARYVSYFTRASFARGQQVNAARTRKRGVLCRVPLMERLSIAAYSKA